MLKVFGRMIVEDDDVLQPMGAFKKRKEEEIYVFVVVD